MSDPISTFDVYPPSAAPEATRVHLFHAKQIPSGDSQSIVLWARIPYISLVFLETFEKRFRIAGAIQQNNYALTKNNSKYRNWP